MGNCTARAAPLFRATPTEKPAHSGPCAEARQLRKAASERERQLQWGGPLCLDLRALAAHRVFDGATRDGTAAVGSNLYDEPRDDRRFLLQCTTRWCLDELGFVVVIGGHIEQLSVESAHGFARPGDVA